MQQPRVCLLFAAIVRADKFCITGKKFRLASRLSSPLSAILSSALLLLLLASRTSRADAFADLVKYPPLCGAESNCRRRAFSSARARERDFTSAALPLRRQFLGGAAERRKILFCFRKAAISVARCREILYNGALRCACIAIILLRRNSPRGFTRRFETIES